MLDCILCFCPPALHARTAALIGDSATLHFFTANQISEECVLKIASETVDRCYVELPDSVTVHQTVLPEVMRVLKKGAKICVRHRAEMKWTDIFLFGGFVDCVQREGDGVMLESTSAKPIWEAGAAVPLRKSTVTSAAGNGQTLKAVSGSEKPKVWTISADDDELMDEDALLDAADLQPKPRPPPSDCELSEGRKACKNCTCGRADMENTEGNNTAPSTVAATSACGSCYLGDAFRCASCPYKGLPPFKPGEQVVISTD